MTAEQRAKAHEPEAKSFTFRWPSAASCPIYHLSGDSRPDQPLRLSGPVLADIFLGRITRWNDPALAELNPESSTAGPPDQGRVAVGPERDDGRVRRIPGENAAATCGRRKTWATAWTQRSRSASGRRATRRGRRGRTAGRGDRLRRAGVRTAHDRALSSPRPCGIAPAGFVVASPESVTAAAASLAEIPADLCFSIVDAAGAGRLPDQRHRLGRVLSPSAGRSRPDVGRIPALGDVEKRRPAVRRSAWATPRCRIAVIERISAVLDSVEFESDSPGVDQPRQRTSTGRSDRVVGDVLFRTVCRACGVDVIGIAVSLVVVLAVESWPFFSTVGFELLARRALEPRRGPAELRRARADLRHAGDVARSRC